MKLFIIILLLVLFVSSVDARHRRKRRFHHAKPRPVKILRDYGDGTFDCLKAYPLVQKYLTTNGVTHRIKLGQGSIHNRLGLIHVNAFDVGIDPRTVRGKKLIKFLQLNKFPFLAIDGRKRGVSSGPHIHVGFPSPRMDGCFKPGTVDGKFNNVRYPSTCSLWERKLKIPLGCL